MFSMMYTAVFPNRAEQRDNNSSFRPGGKSVVPWSAPVCPLEDVLDQLDASAGGGR